VATDSRQTGVGERYAVALFDLASDADQIVPVENDLKTLKRLRAESGDLRRVMDSPAFAAEDRARALDAVAQRAAMQTLTRKFLGLLAANRRVAVLPQVIDAYMRLSAERRGVVAAEVTTAVPLTDAQTQGLKASLRQALGKDPEITTRVDPAILGGLKVRVGSRLFDSSVKTRLDQLKFALKRA
jgi:F-type H+-transporting ATPase subunit delta